MNWVNENKFLSGFVAVMLVGVGVLGFLLFTAKGAYEEALTGYQEKSAELSRLQKSPTYPNQKNLDKLAEQRKQVTAEVNKLADALAAQQIAPEEISPAAFQDRLRAAVTGLRTKAQQANPPVGLPEKFFLAFDEYETAPPDPAATVALGRQLKILEWTVAKLIDNRVSQVTSLTREKLPEEGGKAKPDEKKPAPGSKADKGAKVAVRMNRFEVVFLAEQGRFREVLNSIIDYKGQFIIPRVVTVKNEKDKGPARAVIGLTDPNAPAAVPGEATTPPPVAGIPASGAAAAPVSSYIVGEERVEVRLVLEAVDFTPAATK